MKRSINNKEMLEELKNGNDVWLDERGSLNIKRSRMFEEKCKCGAEIPRGFGYYNYGSSVRCFFCGRNNKKSKLNLKGENQDGHI